MNNDITPTEASSWSGMLEQLNIPKFIAGPAGDALSRLVGRVIDIPSEYVKNFQQGITDKREARSEVSKALAKAAATSVSADSDLVQRAAQSFLAKELRSQTNKEAVAGKAIEELAHKHGEESSSSRSPDDDWFNIFEQYAENASSDRLRILWGKILASEIRTPRSFSLRTMRFISELDAETATLFQKHSPRIVDGQFMVKAAELQGDHLDELLELESAGILTGVNGSLSKRFKNSSGREANLILRFPHKTVFIRTQASATLAIPNLLLTSIGREIQTILSPGDDTDAIREFVDQIDKTAVRSVVMGVADDAGTRLKDYEVLYGEVD